MNIYTNTEALHLIPRAVSFGYRNDFRDLVTPFSSGHFFVPLIGNRKFMHYEMPISKIVMPIDIITLGITHDGFNCMMEFVNLRFPSDLFKTNKK